MQRLLRRPCALLAAAPQLHIRSCSVPAGGQAALTRAARLLRSRLRTRGELQAKLLGTAPPSSWRKKPGVDEPLPEPEVHSPEATEWALKQCEELRMVDDAAFARAFAAHKWRTSSWASSRLHQALAQRGVDGETARLAVEALFAPGGEAHTESEESEEGCGEAQLLSAARRVWSSHRRADVETKSRRLQRWLAARGHRWSEVSEILQALKSEDAADAPG